MHKNVAFWTGTGSAYRVILCALSYWSRFSWTKFQCFVSPCYFLFSVLALPPNCPAMGQYLPCGSSLQLSLHFYSSWLLLPPQCLWNCITSRFSSTIRQLFFDNFHLHAIGPLSVLWSQFQNESQEAGRVLPFPTSIISSLLGGLPSCWSLSTNWATGPFNTQLH